ncbi:catalase HPII, partial [Tolypothrix sp. PCC 7601]
PPLPQGEGSKRFDLVPLLPQEKGLGDEGARYLYNAHPISLLAEVDTCGQCLAPTICRILFSNWHYLSKSCSSDTRLFEKVGYLNLAKVREIQPYC